MTLYYVCASLDFLIKMECSSLILPHGGFYNKYDPWAFNYHCICLNLLFIEKYRT